MWQANMPAKVAELVVRYNLDPTPPAGTPETPNTLIAPALYATEERADLESEEWPAVIVNALTTGRVRWVDLDTATTPPGEVNLDAGATVYAFEYRLRGYVYVRGADYPDTDLARKRLLLGMRELLLVNLDLDPAAPGTAIVDPGSITESLSGLVPDLAGRTTAAGYIELTMRSYEAARITPASTDQAVTAVVTVTGPFPTLDPL